MTAAEPLAVAETVVHILEELGIRYVIGGSVASSVLGEPRSTLDVDIMAKIDEGQARALCDRLQSDFYADADAAAEAVRFGSAFKDRKSVV